jgi:predicted dienelactone hydrolase
MSHRSRMWAQMLLMLVMLLSFSFVVAQDVAGPEPVGERPDSPPYGLHGPYWVGTQRMVIDAETDPLWVTVWYPALNPTGAPEEVVYDMAEGHVLRTMIPADAPFTVNGHALLNAEADLAAAPYPLVIYSHGYTAPMWYVFAGEHLASWGFVVIAPDHLQDSWDNVYTNLVRRLLDVKRTITFADSLTASDGSFAGLIDTDHIAVGGHSAGGMISYGAGGGTLNWEPIKAYCAAPVPDDPACNNLDIQYAEILELLNISDPNDPLPAIWDSRVDAIFPEAGTDELYGADGLATVNVATLIMYGTVDAGVPWMSTSYPLVGSQTKAEVVFQNAGHGIFYNHCEAFPYLLDYGVYWACSDAVWDLHRSHDLVNHFTTAFLLDTLKGDTEAHAALAVDAVDFAGVTYQAEGY